MIESVSEKQSGLGKLSSLSFLYASLHNVLHSPIFIFVPPISERERAKSSKRTDWMIGPCADVPGHLHIVQVWMREVQKNAGCTKLGLVVFQVNLNILAINLSVKISRFFQ